MKLKIVTLIFLFISSKIVSSSRELFSSVSTNETLRLQPPYITLKNFLNKVCLQFILLKLKTTSISMHHFSVQWGVSLKCGIDPSELFF